MDTYREIRNTLVHRLDLHTGRQGRMDAHLRRQTSELPDDWTERASEIGNEEVLVQLDDAGRHEIEAMRSAIERIDNGEYGTCEACGEPIPLARLEAFPLAVRCVECEAWEEKFGG
ncbi:MAG: TraR/DksA family transcriptional regulator [Deltaproteobacteria bacterium]|nr:TraR/DksA family transcriptional regulator [Deltaproteobacteria bacterium]